MAHSKETAEALFRLACNAEILRQISLTRIGFPSFVGYEKARQQGELAFFKAMGVKCKTINPAESVRRKGKVFTLSPTKDEAVEVSERVHDASLKLSRAFACSIPYKLHPSYNKRL